jgi:hypothetical protein
MRTAIEGVEFLAVQAQSRFVQVHGNSLSAASGQALSAVAHVTRPRAEEIPETRANTVKGGRRRHAAITDRIRYVKGASREDDYVHGAV